MSIFKNTNKFYHHHQGKDANLHQWLPLTDPPFELVRQSAERRAIHSQTNNK